MLSAEVFYRESQKINQTKQAMYWWKNRQNLSTGRVVYLAHGMGEHAGRYEDVATFFCEKGYDVVSLDLPGHGLSAKEGGQKKMADFSTMVEETEAGLYYWMTEGPLAKLLAKKGQKLQQVPWFILGHSMGALVSLELISRGKSKKYSYDFAQKACLIGPPLKLKLPVPWWKVKAAELLLNVTPDLMMDSEIKTSDLSYDEASNLKFQNDPLRQSCASPRLFISMRNVADRLFEEGRNFEIPIQLMAGEDDPVVSVAALKEFYARMNTHKKLIVIPHAKHEILNDLCKKEVYQMVADWFK